MGLGGLHGAAHAPGRRRQTPYNPSELLRSVTWSRSPCSWLLWPSAWPEEPAHSLAASRGVRARAPGSRGLADRDLGVGDLTEGGARGSRRRGLDGGHVGRRRGPWGRATRPPHGNRQRWCSGVASQDIATSIRRRRG